MKNNSNTMKILTWRKAFLGEGFVQIKGHAWLQGEIVSNLWKYVDDFKNPLQNYWANLD